MNNNSNFVPDTWFLSPLFWFFVAYWNVECATEILVWTPLLVFFANNLYKIIAG